MWPPIGNRINVERHFPVLIKTFSSPLSPNDLFISSPSTLLTSTSSGQSLPFQHSMSGDQWGVKGMDNTCGSMGVGLNQSVVGTIECGSSGVGRNTSEMNECDNFHGPDNEIRRSNDLTDSSALTKRELENQTETKAKFHATQTSRHLDPSTSFEPAAGGKRGCSWCANRLRRQKNTRIECEQCRIALCPAPCFGYFHQVP